MGKYSSKLVINLETKKKFIVFKKVFSFKINNKKISNKNKNKLMVTMSHKYYSTINIMINQDSILKRN